MKEKSAVLFILDFKKIINTLENKYHTHINIIPFKNILYASDILGFVLYFNSGVRFYRFGEFQAYLIYF
jgi:hypothetical protein